MDYANKEYGYYSNCCGAEVIWTDICAACLEHCEPIDEEEEDNEIRR